jgi:pSer/pThr/pTyr-binding forkhead associated (FHA) protein
VEAQEFPLEGDELVIGRASEVQISIPDTSVSRKHALVRWTDAGWELSDLGSGNGTMLNGATLEVETILAQDDVVGVGDTQLVFMDDRPNPGARAPVRTTRVGVRGRRGRDAGVEVTPAQKRRRLLIAGTVLAIVFVAAIGAKVYADRNAAAVLAARQASEGRHEALAVLFQDAKKLIRAGKWTDARVILLDLKERDAQFFETQNVGSYLERAEIEIPNEAAIAEALAALRAGQLTKANAAVNRVKKTTQETVLRTARADLAKQISAKIVSAREMLSTANDVASMQSVIEMLGDVLGVRADDVDVIELMKSAEARMARLKNPVAMKENPDAAAGGVQQLYQQGDIVGALAAARNCGVKSAVCRQLEASIKEYDGKAKRIDELSESELSSMNELDRKISGGALGAGSKAVRTQVAAKLFVKASQAKSSGNVRRAIELGRLALQADGAHSGAQTLVNEVKSQAHNSYLRGYQLRETSPDDAVRLFKEVLTMTPPEDEDHQKAQQWLIQIQQQ